jgi:RimJ/RimL family protein N-acetyltransferase
VAVFVPDDFRRSIEGKRVQLIPMSFADTHSIVRWRNDPDIAAWFVSQHKFTAEGHERWLGSKLTSPEDFNWVLAEKGGPKIGALSIYNVDAVAGSAEFGRLMVGEASHRGRGFAKEACTVLLAHALASGLSNIFLDVKEANQGAIRLYLALGFEPRQANADVLVRMTLQTR